MKEPPVAGKALRQRIKQRQVRIIDIVIEI